MIEAEAAPDSMNNDDNHNNHSYSSSDIGIGDDTRDQKPSPVWGTWEELLLACAVKRHGFRDWDSVAMEVQSRSSLPRLLITALNCKERYRDLKRRFEERPTEEDGDELDEEEADEEGERGKREADNGKDKVDDIPWLEQLRSLRMAELRRELEEYDVSILSLQLKVKKLEEERERSVGYQKPDLDGDLKRERPENDGNEPAKTKREEVISPVAAESDRDNRSINESNSTASGGKPATEEHRVGGEGTSQAREGSGKLDPTCKAAEEGTFSRGSEVSHSGELGESGTSAGFGRARKRKERTKRSGKELEGGAEMKSIAGKSQPLIGFLDMIRAHPRGSLFERRLPHQETKEYKGMIRQHLDIETIERKLEQGFYAASTLAFYRDLHLLFTNAIVFFPQSSSQSMAAHQLRTLVSTHINKHTRRSGSAQPDRAMPAHPRGAPPTAAATASLSARPDPETSDSSLTRTKSSAPLVACGRRSFASTKPSPSSSTTQKEDKRSDEALGENDKILTGVRSSRRTNKGVSAIAKLTKLGTTTNNKKQTTPPKTSSSNDNKEETPKSEKKVSSSVKTKKKSVADFLKRLKNSPKKGGSTSKDQNKSGRNSDTKTRQRESRNSNNGKIKKKAEEDHDPPSKRNTGRQQKKAAAAAAPAAEVVESSGKRGRETSGKDNKRPNKRSKR